MANALPVPGRNVAQLQQVTLAHNQAVQVITMGNKAVLCCKHEDLKNMSFRTHGSSYCCIPKCKNFRGKIPNMSFFQFPKDVGRCKTWVSFTTRDDLKKKDPTLLPRSGFAICAAHFEGSMFMNPNARNRLIHCAIPTIFDPSCPPPPASIKELAARFSDNIQDNLQLSLEEGDLCIFHRKFIKTVTVLETDISDIHYCMTCGSPIEVIKEVSPGAYQAICNRRHAILFTTEFASKCQEWVNSCHNLDRMKEVANLENKCHLCEEHFSEMKDSAVALMDYNDMHSNLTSSQLLFPPAEEVTVTTTPAPTGAQEMVVRNPPFKHAVPYPSLPSCFFSVGGYTARLDKILEENALLVREPSNCQFTQTDQAQKSVLECNLSKNLKNCRVKIFRLKKRIAALEDQSKKPPNLSAQMLSKELPKYLKGACLRLVQEQLKVSRATGRGIRWSEDFLLLAKIIHRDSSKAYSILKRIMLLPTRSTIHRHQMVSGVLPSLTDFLKSAFPSEQGNNLTAEVPGVENSTMTELRVEDVNCAAEISDEEEDIAESENEEKERSDGGESNSNEELPISTEDESEPTEQQSVEVQVLQDEACVQLMSHEDMRIYEMYAQAAAAIQNDSGNISLNGNETAVTIINVIPVSKEN